MQDFFFSLGHLYQQSLQKTQASEAASGAAEAQRAARALEDRLDRLTLACTALWQLLKDRAGLTEEDLLATMSRIDLADGREDGKLRRTEVSRCSDCGRALSTRHSRCLYCGSVNLSRGAFDSAL